MKITEWWPLVAAETQDWLLAHNGEALPQAIVEDIEQAASTVTPGSAIVSGETGERFLPDEAVDWIEAIANGEDPD